MAHLQYKGGARCSKALINRVVSIYSFLEIVCFFVCHQHMFSGNLRVISSVLPKSFRILMQSQTNWELMTGDLSLIDSSLIQRMNDELKVKLLQYLTTRITSLLFNL